MSEKRDEPAATPAPEPREPEPRASGPREPEPSTSESRRPRRPGYRGQYVAPGSPRPGVTFRPAEPPPAGPEPDDPDAEAPAGR